MTARASRGAQGQSDPSAATMSIGTVLEQLLPEFPDTTISKIRFLESEGLVTPQRAASGYRRFSALDIERLRFVLTAQRDQYLPLKVIREHLEAADRAAENPDNVVVQLRPDGKTAALPSSGIAITPEAFAPSSSERITRDSLCQRAKASPQLLRELERSGLISPTASGFFDENAVAILVTAKALADYGIEVRHLRGFKTAADREAGLAAQIARPIAQGRDADAKARAEELARELAALSVTLHTRLVKVAVQQELER